MQDTANTQREAKRFEAIVAPHFDALYRAGLRLTRTRADAEDLVQEVCLRAYPELERLETLEQPRAWLLRIQYRIFVDETRRRRRAPFAPADASPAELAISDEPGPEELTDELLRRRRLARVWNALEPSQRALLALHAEGYSLGELEAVTGISKNALGVRLHRARARLAKLMRNDTGGHLELARMEG
jgi:RNA polymerase sigma-70 factor (ECF subfamily)